MSAVEKVELRDIPVAWRIPYALGFSVIPIKERDKRPSLSSWLPYQTTRAPLATVREWARPNANIGIVTGAVSGLLVLDLDSDAAIVEAQRRGLPDTLRVRTGKGEHVYFRHPGGTVGNRAGLFPGADIRGDGGYVVTAGSVHQSGAHYVWIGDPETTELASAPAWLLTALRRGERAVDEAVAKVGSAPHGKRNDTLNLEAFKLGRKRGLPDAAAERVAQAAQDAGLEPDEIAATVRSGGKAGARAKPDLSEDSIARAFTATYGDRLRFDHSAGKWYEWTGSRWQVNETKVAYHYARQMAVELSDGDSSFSRSSVASGVESFARADTVHAVTAKVWDNDPWLLGTPGGTVDLRNGDYFDARRADLITKQTGVSPEAGQPTRWLSFLSEATGGDAEMMRFLQQIAGYCLTGLTNEHALFFIYGPGGNGKSVFLNVLNYVLGEYATTAGMDTFTASRSDRHPTDLAMLNGARMVSASETEEGRAWAESRIKQLTGGDKISARFMRQDFFEFVPQFKLLIVGNHAPVLANVDEAAKRRFNILPFTRTPTTPDRQLEDKLKAEAPRILAWAIAGCHDWRENGLCRPVAVTEATAEYFEEQDLFGQWLNDRCERSPSGWELPTPLFNDWADYARAAGDDPGNARGMAAKLKRAGFRAAKNNGLRIYRGLSMRTKPSAFHD